MELGEEEVELGVVEPGVGLADGVGEELEGLGLEGLGILVVEKAINADVKAVKDVVNGVVGFALI